MTASVLSGGRGSAYLLPQHVRVRDVHPFLSTLFALTHIAARGTVNVQSDQ